MVINNRQKEQILAAHFAATNLGDPARDFETLIDWISAKDQYNQLKLWWNDMDALRVIRKAEHYIKNQQPENRQLIDPTKHLSPGENGFIQFDEKSIGKIYSYYRTVLPQEMQIKIAYDSLIDRFWKFVQQKKCAIRLSENNLAIQIFVPQTDPNAEFDLSFEWDKFIKFFAYSRNELYKSFVLFVNHIKIAQTNRSGAGVGYIRFPPATKEMADYLAAFYFATLKNQILYDTAYRDSNKAVQNAQTKVEEYNSKLNQSTLTPRKKVLNEKKLKEWQTKLSLAKVKFESVKQTNQKSLNFSLSELHEQIGDEDFKRITELSRQFHGRGIAQFGPSVKSKSKKGNIEGTIIDILNEPLSLPACPLVPINQIPRFIERRAGDMKGSNFCYSCGKLFSKENQKYKANRFVLGAPSKRPQSGGSETRPNVCGECMTVAFACPVKLTSGAIVVQLAPRSQADQSFSIENHLRMLTLGELNLVAGRYLLINCSEFVGSDNNRKFVSKEIGQVQYTLWQVAQMLPTAALEEMKFTLFTEESKIRLPTRHLVWLSHLHEAFSPHITIKDKNRNRINASLAQAIRLIQKDEVISAIYELITAKPIEAKRISDWSYSEKRSLEELREKHWELLLKKSSEGDKLMEKQAEIFRDVAALTGLTYTYCSYVFSSLKESKGQDTAESEVKKLIENVGNPSFFNYRTSQLLSSTRASSTRATMYRNDDNYFCYDQARCLLSELPGRDEDAQDPLVIYFDDILNAYAKLSEKYNEVEWKNLSYQLKLSLYARFPILFKEHN